MATATKGLTGDLEEQVMFPGKPKLSSERTDVPPLSWPVPGAMYPT